MRKFVNAILATNVCQVRLCIRNARGAATDSFDSAHTREGWVGRVALTKSLPGYISRTLTREVQRLLS